MEVNIAVPAALIGDPARAAILMALLDGRAQPAGALAYAAALTPQAASNHLARLLDGGLLRVETQGRHRYYRLAGAEIAAALEALACVAPALRALDQPRSPAARALRHGRSCYDHLAGQLGVAVAATLEDRGLLRPGSPESPDPSSYAVTEAGRAWFADLGIDVAGLRPGSRGLAWRCLDWTERRHHLAGPLGVRLLARCVALGWLARDRPGRSVRLTEAGRRAFPERLGVAIPGLTSVAEAA